MTDRSLLVKLYYQNADSIVIAVRSFRILRKLKTGLMTTRNLQKIVLKFEKTGSLSLKPCRGRKLVEESGMEGVAKRIQQRWREQQFSGHFQNFSSCRPVLHTWF